MADKTIEEVVIGYLNSNRNAIEYPAYGDTPYKHQLPAHHYMVQKTGSTTRDRITTAQIVVQSVTVQSKAQAARMNEQMVGVMEGIVGTSGISACHINSDYDYTDTTSKRWRYQAVFDITYNREVLSNG